MHCTHMVQVALVAVMGGAYPSSEDLPFGGTEFNFDCGRVGPLSLSPSSVLYGGGPGVQGLGPGRTLPPPSRGQGGLLRV